MDSLTDQQLLREYSASHSEAAFAELVRRHVDLVYSAALRMVRDGAMAQDVAQAVFLALAAQARQLTERAVLAGWLHRTTQNLAANAVRSEVRRRAREEQAALMNETSSTEADATWEEIAPELDAALGELSEPDRDAVLLRYFQRKSASEMARALGISEDAAQKRLNRAVERLREQFARRGVTVGAAGMVVLISANAVQAAPVAVLATISTSTAAASTVAVATTTAKTIAMTALQKTLIAVSITAAVGAGIYEARQASALRNQVQLLEQRQGPLAEQLQQLQRERDGATNQLAALTRENARLSATHNSDEILKLRGQVGALRQAAANIPKTNAPTTGIAKLMGDPAMREFIRQVQVKEIRARYAPLFQELKLSPDQVDQFVQAIADLWQNNSATLAEPHGDSAGTTNTFSDALREMQTKLQSVLGDSGYARFGQFQTEIPAHTTISLLNDQLGDNRLSDDQAAQVLAIVKSEPYKLTHGIAGELDTAFFGSQQDIDEHLQAVAESGQRIVQQAASFLTPEQATALNTVLTNGITARKNQGAALTSKN